MDNFSVLGSMGSVAGDAVADQLPVDESSPAHSRESSGDQWAQPVGYTDDEWDRFNSWRQWEVKKAQLKKSVWRWWKFSAVLQNPWLQFGLFAVLEVAVMMSPTVRDVADTVVTYSGGFMSVMKKVLAVQSAQLLFFGCLWFRKLCSNCSKTAITSQVAATRANIVEWRSFLQFASQWHSVSLQGAYSLWQEQLVCAPTCPANQWLRIPSGMPMIASDQAVAESRVTEQYCRQLKIENSLTELHEMWQHCQHSVRQFSTQHKTVLTEVAEKYMEFKSKSVQFHNMGSAELNQYMDEVKQAVSNFRVLLGLSWKKRQSQSTTASDFEEKKEQ